MDADRVTALPPVPEIHHDQENTRGQYLAEATLVSQHDVLIGEIVEEPKDLWRQPKVQRLAFFLLLLVIGVVVAVVVAVGGGPASSATPILDCSDTTVGCIDNGTPDCSNTTVVCIDNGTQLSDFQAAPVTGEIVSEGSLFGWGFDQYKDRIIRKSLDEVNNICLPECRDDNKCTGFAFRIDARYDGRTNGNCWFMTGEIKYVGSPANSGGGVYVKSIRGGYCVPTGDTWPPAGMDCLAGLICDADDSTCITDCSNTTVGCIDNGTQLSDFQAAPVTGKIVSKGNLFGWGFDQYKDLEIRKSLDDVNNICLPECRDDNKCTGFAFRIDARYDGRTNGNCWFMTGEIKYVGSPANSGGGVYVKSIRGGYCVPTGDTWPPAGMDCLAGLICDADDSTCITA
jgi:hypothetical protein